MVEENTQFSMTNLNKAPLMQILVFKTDVRFKKDVHTITRQLNGMQGIIKWNFDLSDSDKILRVQTNSLPPVAVEQTLQQVGFYCRELE
jgi:hypothetical protein